MAIDKLNKTFESGQKLLASEMNQISGKIDELVDGVTTNESNIPDVSEFATKTELQEATPTIGENGNWVVGGQDTGKPSKGADGVSLGEISLVQTTGTSTESVMSQKAVTDELVKRTTELNISALYPTQGIDGSNKYTLETAIAQVPSEYRTMQGLKVLFVNESGDTESWEFKGGSWAVSNFSEVGAKKFSELDKFNAYFKSSTQSYIYNKTLKSGYNIIDDIGLEVGKKYVIMLSEAITSLTFYGKKDDSVSISTIAKIELGNIFADFIYDQNYSNKQLQVENSVKVYIIEVNSELIDLIDSLKSDLDKFKPEINQNTENITEIKKIMYGDSAEYPTNKASVTSTYTNVTSYIERSLTYEIRIEGDFSQAILYGTKVPSGLSNLGTITPENNPLIITIPDIEYSKFQFETQGYGDNTVVNITQQDTDSQNKGLIQEFENLTKTVEGYDSVIKLIEQGASESSVEFNLYKADYGFRDGNEISYSGCDTYIIDVTLYRNRSIKVTAWSQETQRVGAVFVDDSGAVIGEQFYPRTTEGTDYDVPYNASNLKLSNIRAQVATPVIVAIKESSLKEFKTICLSTFTAIQKTIDGKQSEIDFLRNKQALSSYSNDFRWAKFDKTIFVFTIDDSNAYLYNLYEAFHSRSVPLVAAVIPDTLEQSAEYTIEGEVVRLTRKEVLDKIIEDGGEIMTHTNPGLNPDGDDAEYYRVFGQTKLDLYNAGFRNIRGAIAVGAGIVGDARVDKYVRRYYEYADKYGLRTSEAYVYINPDGISSRVWLGELEGIEGIKTKIDEWCSKNQLVVIGLHGTLSGEIQTNEDAETIGQMIDYILTKDNAAIMTYGEVYDTYRSSVLENYLKSVVDPQLRQN